MLAMLSVLKLMEKLLINLMSNQIQNQQSQITGERKKAFETMSVYI